jgi:hypothetical protein
MIVVTAAIAINAVSIVIQPVVEANNTLQYYCLVRTNFTGVELARFQNTELVSLITFKATLHFRWLFAI